MAEIGEMVTRRQSLGESAGFEDILPRITVCFATTLLTIADATMQQLAVVVVHGMRFDCFGQERCFAMLLS